MTSWDQSNKEKIRINPETIAGAVNIELNKTPNYREVSKRVETSVEEHGGDIDVQSKLLFEAWDAMSGTFMEQSRHISTIKIVRRMVDIITSSGAPAAPMVVLALALKEGHEKLMAKVRKLDPDLADSVEQDENK